MTLVLASMKPEMVVIAADRVFSINGKAKKSNAVKLVLFYSDMVFGFMGAARMMDSGGSWSTDVWLARTLCRVGKRSIADAITAIKERAEESIERLVRRGTPRDKLKLAILGVGWSRNPADLCQAHEQLICVISNCYAENGEWLSHVNSSFEAKSWNPHLLPLQFYLYSVGEDQSPEEREWLAQKCRESTEELTIGQHLDILKDSIRQCSTRILKEQKKQSVGKDILAAVLHRHVPSEDWVLAYGPQCETGMLFFNGDENDAVASAAFASHTNPAFYRFPDGREDGIYEAPHMVCPGFETFAHVVLPGRIPTSPRELRDMRRNPPSEPDCRHISNEPPRTDAVLCNKVDRRKQVRKKRRR